MLTNIYLTTLFGCPVAQIQTEVLSGMMHPVKSTDYVFLYVNDHNLEL